MEFVHNYKALDAFSVSAGVVSYPKHGKSVDKLLQIADRALYKAKENGRNQVVKIADGDSTTIN